MQESSGILRTPLDAQNASAIVARTGASRSTGLAREREASNLPGHCFLSIAGSSHLQPIVYSRFGQPKWNPPDVSGSRQKGPASRPARRHEWVGLGDPRPDSRCRQFARHYREPRRTNPRDCRSCCCAFQARRT